MKNTRGKDNHCIASEEDEEKKKTENKMNSIKTNRKKQK